MAKRTKHRKQHSKFRLDDLSLEKRRRFLESFATEFSGFLEAPEESRRGRKEIMDDLKVDVRQFDGLLRHLYRDGYLQLAYHRLSGRADRLKAEQVFQALDEITVVGGSDPERFAQAAAVDFIKSMVQIGQLKRGKHADLPLNVGIVSGNTTGSVVRAAMKLNWSKDLENVRADELPKIQVFALNVCLTVPDHLPGNATLLAYQLAEKIRSEGGEADGYGLSAPLMVRKDDLRSVDEAPQTFDVLKFTEPYRVREKLGSQGVSEQDISETDTELDIVLTGVGELPRQAGKGSEAEEKGSIFYRLAEAHGFKMDAIIAREHIVGDIAFTAIRSDGTPVTLRKHDLTDVAQQGPSSAQLDHDGESTEYVFYSAVQLPVLEAMAGSKDKSVILVARDAPMKDKVPAIFASLGGKGHRYASRLVIDERTANGLYHY